MTSDFSRFTALTESFPHETVTHSRVEDVALPHGAGTLALIRLDNDHPKRPNTLGPGSLIEFGEAVAAQLPRAQAGEISGLAVIGQPGVLAAGADIVSARELTDPDQGRGLADLGHEAYNLLEDFPVPTFAFISGTALGGGLEIALAAHYRTVSSDAKALGLPEIFLGLIPGWGGIYRVPRLIGPERAVEVIFKNPLNNNRSLKGPEAYEIGLADALLDPDSFEQQSLDFAARIISGDAELTQRVTTHREHDAGEAAWQRAIETARSLVAAKTGDTAPGPLRALEVFEQVRHRSRDEDRKAEVEALGQLLVSDEFKNVVYAFMELVQKRAKQPAGVPEAAPREIHKVGVVGAGLMASQLALVFAQQLQVPVVLTDLDQDRVDKALDYVRDQTQKQLKKGRLNEEQATALADLVTGSTDKSVYADADFVIEAVFEEIGVKKQVFAELEEIISSDAVLATNTSSLSVTEMAADLQHPERVIGFHFFNPVAVMPLIEIARTAQTADEPIATAFALAAKLRKTPVLTKDATAFVVNRVLLRLMAEVQKTFDEGTDARTADEALKPLGLPMTPFDLLAMVGLPVAQHVTESLHASFGERFYVSSNLQALIDHGVTEIWSIDAEGHKHIKDSTLELMSFGDDPKTTEEVRTTVLEALAEEIGLLLEEEVVASPKDVDLCMILGAGWPFHRGGITPYLDQQGISQRVNGKPFAA
ncbi:3-hydroxyacyl-CoA dehydrogenase NAD-binding domain-containing protein [Nesterenkonia massiliensis]|uniref:3-hydroxyacyl-CoA dehydrogenase NAD-binding domain-containing protein n=1 Tax=Nesterenkonia massiliensis TaxID=1232429 RepID=A0ABT2HQZ8_9MICC|nr:3-hydroxyacyl-CoA dehydrogenase NAD-binding domain-containing protein [Nesterenkonia massiliensis]MCT1607118.1 3-hydroxyacyl-CoA dehydrogenase NAD-binding domain-containing protein [Nesterenkonia massiliensis]